MMKLNRIFRIFLPIFIFVIIVLIPIVSYTTIKSSISDIEYLTDYYAKYDLLIIWFVIFGLIITVCTYFIYYFPKYSVKREIILLVVSFTFLIYFLLTYQLSIIHINVKNVTILLNFSGVSILFIIFMVLNISKNVFDLIDFMINKNYYERKLQHKIEMKRKSKSIKK